MPVRRWKRCRGAPLISPCRAGEKHDLRKANVDRRRPAPQYAPRRLAGRNPVLALLPLGAGRGEGMAPACRGRAVLLAEGALQEQLSKGEGGEAVAAGVKREKGYSINNKKELPYSIPYSILFPKEGEGPCHYLCQRKRKSFAVRTVNVIKR